MRYWNGYRWRETVETTSPAVQEAFDRYVSIEDVRHRELNNPHCGAGDCEICNTPLHVHGCPRTRLSTQLTPADQCTCAVWDADIPRNVIEGSGGYAIGIDLECNYGPDGSGGY